MNVTLEKMLQCQGFGSRKFCRSLVLEHRVEIGGIICTDPGLPIETDNLSFCIDGEQWEYRKKLYLVLNKPAGYECSHQPQHHPSVFSLFPPPFIHRGLQCVGRLDQDTTGMLLLSDDGNFIHRYTSPRKKVPKIYQITTADPFRQDQLERLENGVELRNEKTITTALKCRLISCQTRHSGRQIPSSQTNDRCRRQQSGKTAPFGNRRSFTAGISSCRALVFPE